MPKLTFVVPNLPRALSLDIRESEFLHNAMIVTNVVANLVVPQSDGRFAPGIAESWSDEGTKWTFKIREGYTCTDGEKITAEGFRKSLIRALQTLAKKHDVPVFNQLAGFSEFQKENLDKIGISADGPNLVFEFKTPPKRGFIEYLAFPNLGYSCEGNYKDGQWIDSQKIISSGAFEVQSIGPETVVLKKRANWYKNIEVDEVTILKKDPTNIADNSELTIMTGQDLPDKKEGFSYIKEIPQSVGALIVRPEGALRNLTLRQILADKIIEIKKRTELQSQLAFKADFFFTSQQSPVTPRAAKVDSTVKPTLIKVLSYPLANMTTPRKFAENVIRSALQELKWPFEIVNSTARTFEMVNSPSYEMKILFAEVGAAVEDWVVDMHFASYLGGQFFDPSGSIAQATTDFRNRKIEYPAFVEKFNQAIYDDASVIPLVHLGNAWLVSDDIDHVITPVMSLPRFDEVRLKK